MSKFAPQIELITRKEARTVSVDCRGSLDGADIITSIVTVEETGTAHLGITDARISDAPLEINQETVPAGKAIQFKVDATGASVKHKWEYEISLLFENTSGDRVEGGVRLKTD